MFQSRVAIVLSLCIVSGLAVLLLSAGLRGDFIFDDYPNIVWNKAVHLDRLGIDALRDSFLGGAAGLFGRPISVFSFSLTHYFFGLDPFAFKAVNLAIHVTNGLLVFFLGIQILSATNLDARRGSILATAGFLATAWLLHPIQLTTIFHVVQRMTSLSAFFLFAALLLHIQGRKKTGLHGVICLTLAWGICWPLSFFSKETGALLPFFVLAVGVGFAPKHFRAP